MSAPADDPGHGQYGQSSPYPDQQTFDGAGAPPAHGAAHADAGKKKKRAYAAGAFEVGSGANAAVGGQLPGGGQFGAPQPTAPGYGGYPQQDFQAPYGGAAQAYGAPQPGAPAGGVGGYQAPDAYYPSGPAPASPPGVGGVTSGIASMQLGAGQPQQGQPAQPARVGPLNQLYPTDLMSQPFNVSELDLPPPPIVLPPNVSSPAVPPVLAGF